MGFFTKIFDALKKTKDNLSTQLRLLFAKNKLGDEFYEELEDTGCDLQRVVYILR